MVPGVLGTFWALNLIGSGCSCSGISVMNTSGFSFVRHKGVRGRDEVLVKVSLDIPNYFVVILKTFSRCGLGVKNQYVESDL